MKLVEITIRMNAEERVEIADPARWPTAVTRELSCRHCGRSRRVHEVTAGEWLRAEADRIGREPGREARVVWSNGKMSVWVNDIRELGNSRRQMEAGL
jgi:hypothetical protein